MSKIIPLALGFANALLVRDRGTILVDTGINVSKEKYLKIFENLAVAPREIGLIVISHGHADHFGHAYELREMTGAPVLCHRNAVDALQTGKNADIITRNELGVKVLNMIKRTLPRATHTVQPDIIMDSTFDLNPYGVAGKVIHTPGHSDCSVSVLLDSGEAIVGDILVSSPFTGEPCIAYFANNEKALLESVRNLLKHAHTFYGGHGGPFSRKEVLQLI